MSWIDNHLAPLVGGTITAGVGADVDGEEWPTLLIRNGERTFLVQFSRDPEGNGPGHPLISEQGAQR